MNGRVDDADDEVRRVVTAVYPEEWGRLVAMVIGMSGDWELAEECAQDAFAQALLTWARDGIPSRPGAWLSTTARNRARDRLRRGGVETRKLRESVRREPPPRDPPPEHDDRLELLFTCCHPALSFDAQVALTLRGLAGLSTAEIAYAFGIPERIMGMRLVRARNRIRHAGIPFRMPPANLLTERLAAVLAVIYLIFREGYAPSDGPEPLRTRLTGEAVTLARMLVALLPGEPETAGLLALLLFTDARRNARFGDDGELVPLEEQDRARWDRAQIREADELLVAALRRGRPGPYQVQAAVAACHAGSPTSADTDWLQIALLYGELARLYDASRRPSAFVELNRAVAVGMAEGPHAGLALLDALAGEKLLAGHHLLPACRADLHRRAGEHAAAAEGYREALGRVRTEPERRYLRRRLTEVAAP